AKESNKLLATFEPPKAWARNTPARLGAALAPFRGDGTLPDYPLGSDFTEVEQRLVKALGWLKANTATRVAKLGTLMRAAGARHEDHEALARMGLDRTRGLSGWIEARLVGLALRETGAARR
ncbi:MAG TPA: acetyl-CoA hydrolase, partial [Pseudoxanthomonas sp.]|nr:acetyl-CoA hydrolase [Pseudoxanthomonas sp.]